MFGVFFDTYTMHVSGGTEIHIFWENVDVNPSEYYRSVGAKALLFGPVDLGSTVHTAVWSITYIPGAVYAIRLTNLLNHCRQV
jgi:hypothetical protein